MTESCSRAALEAGLRMAALYGCSAHEPAHALGADCFTLAMRLPSEVWLQVGKPIRKWTDGTCDRLQVLHAGHHIGIFRDTRDAGCHRVLACDFGRGEEASMAAERWVYAVRPVLTEDPSASFLVPDWRT